MCHNDIDGISPDRGLIGMGSCQPVSRQTGESCQETIALERISSYRLQQRETRGSSRACSDQKQWLPMGAGKPYPPSPIDPEVYVVEFENADDPMHPQNWPMKERYTLSLASILSPH
jgi:DHA1 family multidrug resistance protein-like MFS transporter